MDFIFENVKKKYSLKNNRVNFYQNDDFSLLECVKDDGTKNYIFGKDEMNYKDGLCEDVPYLCSFSKKYYVLDITDSNDSKFTYLTLKSVDSSEVDTVKIMSSYLTDVTIGSYYIFDFSSTNDAVDTTIKKVFENNSILKIREYDELEKITEEECK